MAAASPKRTLATALAAGVTVLLGAAPVGAQQANPQPTSCAGVAFTDPAGDATTTRENLDITAGFFRYVTDSAGENVLTANIRVTNLDETMETGAYYHQWTFRWTAGNTRQFAKAGLGSDGGESFEYGTEEGDRSLRRGTSGRLLLGKDGIIEIVLPVAELALEGKRFTNPHAVSEIVYTDRLLHLYVVPADSAPDSQTGGKPFDVVPCAQESTPTKLQPATAPSGAARAPRLKLEVVVTKLSARKISKRRSFSIGLRAGERTTGLQARLKRGKKLVATGRLASISGKGTVRLRLRGKQLKAGTYTLQMRGRTAVGQVASGRVKVRIRP